MQINDYPIVYAAKNSEEDRLKSQSGGMFAILSDQILNMGGIVYGCVFNKEFEAVHIRAESRQERDAMRYSKYVQSNMLDVMNEVLQDLIDGRAVLFSGTSCQVAGIKSFISCKKKDLLNQLYCVDLVCHGVPSPLVWKDYLEWEKGRGKSDIEQVICRNKRKYGWKSHVTTIELKNGKTVDSRVFPRLFYGHNILRPSCYHCPYKSIHHPGNITIADCWGLEKTFPQFIDDKGVSLVLINDEKGQQLFKKCQPSLDYLHCRIEDCIQQPLIAPYDEPISRKHFWIDYRKMSFTRIAKKYGGYGILAKVKGRVKKILHR